MSSIIDPPSPPDPEPEPKVSDKDIREERERERRRRANTRGLAQSALGARFGDQPFSQRRSLLT